MFGGMNLKGAMDGMGGTIKTEVMQQPNEKQQSQPANGAEGMVNFLKKRGIGGRKQNPNQQQRGTIFDVKNNPLSMGMNKKQNAFNPFGFGGI